MTLFLAIIQLIPAIIQLVKQIEEVVPQSGQGAAKLNMVLDSVNSITSAIPELAQNAVPVQKAVTGIVGATVSMLNAVGVFKKG